MASRNPAIFVRVSLLAAVLAAGGCGAEKVREMEEVPPGIAFEGLEFRSYRGEALAASGRAEHAFLRRDTTDVAATDITVRFPRPREAGDLFTAARGTGNLRAGTAHLEGSPRLVLHGDTPSPAQAPAR
jgi:hypothetical protein